MTTKNSICVKCEILSACMTGCVISKKGRSLISSCKHGGKNAGNRKTCKHFKEADPVIIEERLKLLKGGDG